MGNQVLKSACFDTKQWGDGNSDSLKVAVNLSARQFQKPDDLLQVIENTLSETLLRPENLELEVTESMVMGNVEQTIQILKKIRDMGYFNCYG